MGIRSLSTASISTGTKRSKVWDQSAVVVTNSYESIATVLVGAGGQSTIDFTSIPGTYKHLQLRWFARTNRASIDGDWIGLRFNGINSSATYYGQHYLFGDGSNAQSLADGTAAQIYIERAASASQTSNIFGTGIVDILDYTSTVKNKVTKNMGGLETNGGDTRSTIRLASGMLLSTPAITSITMFPGSGSAFVQHSHFALYGIKG